MKSWLRLAIAVVVLVVVIGFLYWPQKAKPAAAARALVTVTSDQVQRVAIQQPGQPEVDATRSGSDWKLDQPYAFAADAASMASLINSLGNITDAQPVGDASSNLAGFGLDKPATVELGLSDGKAHTFAFGGSTPTGGNVYLRVDNGPIEMAPSYVKDNALKAGFDLQDKSILHFPSGQVTALDITTGGKTAHLVKTGNDWPKAQSDSITSLLDALNDGQMTSMADVTGKDAAKDGLAAPTAVVTVNWAGGSAKLEVGAKKGAAEYYARNSATPAIFAFSDYLMDDITAVTAPKASPAVTGVAPQGKD
ncbi:MAG TPA: DUF4340 domain-containing protein [Terriglobales bacterium]|jgi:hypothetical protein